MKDETKREFEAVFANHAKILEAQKQAKVAKESNEEQFLRAFREKLTSTIKPAFERLRTYLDGKGLAARIEQSAERLSRDGRQESREEIALVLVVGGDSRPAHYRAELPHLALHPDKHRQVVDLHQSTMAPGRGGQSSGIGSVKLEQITEEFLEQKLLALLREVLK